MTNIAQMMIPVRCRCGQVYDRANVTVLSRRADCSTWYAPCCGVYADDRSWVDQTYRPVTMEQRQLIAIDNMRKKTTDPRMRAQLDAMSDALKPIYDFFD